MGPASDAKPAASTVVTTGTPTADGVRRIPVVDEAVDVRRIEVDRGGFRLTKRVTTRLEQVDELLRDSRVEIERRAIGRLLDEDEDAETRHEGAALVIPVVEEVLVVVRRRRLVEEIRVTRIDGTRREAQEVELRREEIDIERLDAALPSVSES